MSDIHERLARLETRLTAVEELREDVRAIRDELTKYRGMIGGAAFLMTCVGTFLSFGKDWLLSHWK